MPYVSPSLLLGPLFIIPFLSCLSSVFCLLFSSLLSQSDLREKNKRERFLGGIMSKKTSTSHPSQPPIYFQYAMSKLPLPRNRYSQYILLYIERSFLVD
ncbi:hypothetical protein OWV82_013097 [Melia azedarach]|uniref:Uncharacterized protein n=1 Tax=Melia azedarach TaxID=155640 RepID=A0ACC1XUP9_MELAZ|nr:hypothetical protein OWV82_013097 [Melia azedarach]